MCILQVTTCVTGDTDCIINIKNYITTNLYLQELVPQRTRNCCIGGNSATSFNRLPKLIKNPVNCDDITISATHLPCSELHQARWDINRLPLQ